MNCTEFQKLNALIKRISSIYKLSTEKLSYLLFDLFFFCVLFDWKFHTMNKIVK